MLLDPHDIALADDDVMYTKTPGTTRPENIITFLTQCLCNVYI